MVQKLKFTVFDVDNETAKLDDDDFLGNLECTLGQVSNYITYKFDCFCFVLKYCQTLVGCFCSQPLDKKLHTC